MSISQDRPGGESEIGAQLGEELRQRPGESALDYARRLEASGVSLYPDPGDCVRCGATAARTALRTDWRDPTSTWPSADSALCGPCLDELRLPPDAIHLGPIDDPSTKLRGYRRHLFGRIAAGADRPGPWPYFDVQRVNTPEIVGHFQVWADLIRERGATIHAEATWREGRGKRISVTWAGPDPAEPPYRRARRAIDILGKFPRSGPDPNKRCAELREEFNRLQTEYWRRPLRKEVAERMGVTPEGLRKIRRNCGDPWSTQTNSRAN